MQFFTSEKNRTSSSHGKNSKRYDKHVKFKHEFYTPSADPEGGDRGPDPPPLGKSQVIWVSIGNKQLNPPGKSWTPLDNVGPPLEP